MNGDLISRKAVIEAMEQAKEQYFDRKVIIGKMQDIVNNLPSAQLENAQTADVVPVVRCEDCKHSAWDALGKCYWCKGKERTADFFCADGERREDGEIY